MATELKLKELSKKEMLLTSGHRMCSGCGAPIIVKMVLLAAEYPVIASNATGCLEVSTCISDYTAWKIPWIHNAFENAAATISGVETMYRSLKRQGKMDREIKFIAFGGDGGTYDIGLQSLSGAMERGHDMLYICYDNGAYMNTGIQRSGLTPTGASTTTSPAGKVWWGNWRPKKNLVGIAAAHMIPYAATSSVGYPQDVVRKVKKALSIKGPKFMQIHVPCPLGWRSDPSQTIKIAQLAVQSGLYPLVEYENGQFSKAFKVSKPVPVEEYLKTQGRFRHLVKDPEHLKVVQAIADANMAAFKLTGE